jgi:hypothetical protein
MRAFDAKAMTRTDRLAGRFFCLLLEPYRQHREFSSQAVSGSLEPVRDVKLVPDSCLVTHAARGHLTTLPEVAVE